MDQKEEGGGDGLRRWSGEDKQLTEGVLSVLRGVEEVVLQLHPDTPVLEVGVIPEVAQPGPPYGLSQFMVVSC